MRISLNEKEFRRLVRGQIVKQENDGTVVEIALQDIGWSAVVTAVRDALLNTPEYGDKKS
jgi:hypothetical protein